MTSENTSLIKQQENIMKLSKLNKLVFIAVTMGTFVSVSLAEGPPDVIDAVGDIVDSIAGAVENPASALSGDILSGVQTWKGTTVIGGNTDITVTAGDITQRITGGKENANLLNLGSASGGVILDGDFTTDVTVGDIRQSVSGEKNVNKANIGSVSN